MQACSLRAAGFKVKGKNFLPVQQTWNALKLPVRNASRWYVKLFRSHSVQEALGVCENRDGWLVAWGFCG